uniref:ZF-HD homeobox protein At4g24660 family n=1 Tax=Cajanus cajan TaxID=3821 RepID=A0A151R7L2_CAJCA|nr:ZF-HD homeobox protein At4g24660 family [Cajanus cajan]
MDITPTTTISNTPSATKSPENHETETPSRINTPTPTPTPPRTATTKTLSFSNGVLKRHHHHHPSIPAAVTYKECLKNHAANLGGHALDGCGEFMQSPAATAADPTSLKCAAYQPHHRHHPPPPFHAATRSPNSASPPPISSSYYPSAPHMLLALSAGLAAPPESTAAPSPLASHSRKRFRTKFSQEQKEKMHKFAEKVGWKMQKRDEDLIHDFCNEVGVDRSVLKVWMHNNKNSLAKKDTNINPINTVSISNNDNANGSDKSFEVPTNNDAVAVPEDRSQDPTRNHRYGGANVGANGSSSSS